MTQRAMDISNSYQSNNNSPMRPNVGGALGYDLNSEKQEIEKITAEVKKELLAKWKKSYANAQIFPASVAMMHPDALEFLLSFNLVSVYDNIAKQAGLDAKGRNMLPRVVWQVAQSKNFESLDQILESQLPLVHSAHVTVADLLQQNILVKVRTLSEKQVVQKVATVEISKKEVQLTLSEALLKYPKVGEMSITGDQIKLRYSPAPVRPSIKNWITDFHDSMGAGKHSPIDRGNFLFHSENGKKLSAIERQRLGTILKSLDEQTLLSIDTDAQIVLFQSNTDESRINNGLNTDHSAVIPRLTRLDSQSLIDARRAGNLEQQKNLDPHFHGDDNAGGQTQPRRDNNSDINLRPLQNQQTSGVERRAAAPNFSANAAGPRVASGFVTEKMPAVKSENAVKPAPFQSSLNEIKNETKSDFFQIPQSKPPIGSDEYNIADTNDSQSDKNLDPHFHGDDNLKDNALVDANAQTSLSFGHLPAGRQVSSSSEERIIEKKTLNEDPNLMSDEDLFNILQAKKKSAGAVSFSSPQKLPVEQSMNPVQTQNIQPVQPSPFRITPSDNSNVKNESGVKIQRNVVDLKN